VYHCAANACASVANSRNRLSCSSGDKLFRSFATKGLVVGLASQGSEIACIEPTRVTSNRHEESRHEPRREHFWAAR